MAAYRFLTTWLFDASREAVWDVIYDAARWPEWWRGVRRAEVVDPGDERSEGARNGVDLGVARLRTTREWMNAAGPFARPFFVWNHHRIMRWGGEGCARRLGCQSLAAS